MSVGDTGTLLGVLVLLPAAGCPQRTARSAGRASNERLAGCTHVSALLLVEQKRYRSREPSPPRQNFADKLQPKSFTIPVAHFSIVSLPLVFLTCNLKLFTLSPRGAF